MRVEVIVLCVYFIGMIAMGLYWNKKAKSSEDFMLGGKIHGTSRYSSDPADYRNERIHVHGRTF